MGAFYQRSGKAIVRHYLYFLNEECTMMNKELKRQKLHRRKQRERRSQN
jgi:hypothetical protein